MADDFGRITGFDNGDFKEEISEIELFFPIGVGINQGTTVWQPSFLIKDDKKLNYLIKKTDELGEDYSLIKFGENYFVKFESITSEKSGIVTISEDGMEVTVNNLLKPYNLTINKDIDGEAINFTATNIFTTPKEAHQFSIDWQALSQGEKGVTMQIDKEGDGVFEQTIISDETMEPPTANAGGPYASTEGTEITFDASQSTDLDGNIVFYEWDFDGDGNYDESSTLPTIIHTYGDNYNGEVKLRVTDDEGIASVAKASANIINSDSVIESFGDQTIEVLDELIFENSFTDAGWLDTHTASIDWGNKIKESIALTEENEALEASGEVQGSHIYNIPGVFIGNLTITDDNGGMGIDEFSITVEKRKTELVYSSDLKGQYSDKATFQAILTDKLGGVAGKTVNFSLGKQTISAVTNSEGVATAEITLNEIPGIYNVRTNFQEDDFYLSSSTSTDFEIMKEVVAVTVENKEGFFDDSVILKATILDNDGEILYHNPNKVNFAVGGNVIGEAVTDENGKAEINWLVDYVPTELDETYPIIVSFIENEYYLSGEGQNDFTLKSAKQLKQNSLEKLKAITTDNKQSQKEIDKAIKNIEESLDSELWIDTSRLDKQQGHKVFDNEKQAVKSLLKIIEEKGGHDNPEIIAKLQDVINDLVEVDTLLTKVAIYDAESIEIDDTDSQKKIDDEISKAKEELEKALQEIADGNPDKAIDYLKASWKSAQLAIDFLCR